MDNYQLHINSDNSIIIEFSEPVSFELTRFILGIKQTIEKNNPIGFIEAVPAYNSLLVIFRADQFSPKKVISDLQQLIKQTKPLAVSENKTHIVPVCYDASFGPDLEHVAQHCGLSTQEVIQRHSEQDYPVFMLGFLPGFLYLGDLVPSLHCPRRDEPRPQIQAGSVGIGGNQTGIYPITSPGGWQIIGRTPITMFNPESNSPAIAKPLDIVRFKSISIEEFKNYEH